MSGARHARRISVACVVGTRPEVIKMAPVIQALKLAPWADVHVIVTAQHRALLDRAMHDFGLASDLDLDAMQPEQTLAGLTSRLTARLDQAFASLGPDVVLAQGDTTTVLVAALCCFYRRIAFGHVEAGLRTHDLGAPFPEEMNRVVTGRLASLHFAPTERARHNLLSEGVDGASVRVVGNTVIDALLYQSSRVDGRLVDIGAGQRLILVTAHRRENFGEPMRGICAAILELSRKHPDVEFLFPVHPNPNVTRIVHETLAGQDRIHLREPLDYTQFISAMRQSHLVLTDSGGVQEEAPALGKPVLVMRADTERPEAIEAGVARLVGAEPQAIVAEVSRLLDDPGHYASMSRFSSPYGDGFASRRIVARLAEHFGAAPQWPEPAEFAYGTDEVAS